LLPGATTLPGGPARLNLYEPTSTISTSDSCIKKRNCQLQSWFSLKTILLQLLYLLISGYHTPAEAVTMDGVVEGQLGIIVVQDPPGSTIE
jgi:hypothetical protein